jgi:putative peptidoglycan lipid II flippase
VQLVIATVNVIAAVTLTQDVEPGHVAAMLALSYGLAYVVGAVLSTTLLSRAIGPVIDRESVVFAARLIVACAIAGAVMVGAVAGLDRLGLGTDTSGEALGALLVAGALGAGAYVGSARLIGLDQLSYVVKSVLRRR